jgi:hypothetical protein
VSDISDPAPYSPSREELGALVDAANQFVFYARETGNCTPEGRLTKVLADNTAVGHAGCAFGTLYFHPFIQRCLVPPTFLLVTGWPKSLSDMLLYAIPRLADAVAVIAKQDNVRLGPDILGMVSQQGCSWHLGPGEAMAPPESLARLERAANTLASILAQAPMPSADVPHPCEEPTATQKESVKSTAAYYVTLDQAAALVNRSKSTLERRKAKMPAPAVKGGGGRPSEWLWSELRPWLEKAFGRLLPEIPPHAIRR